MLFKLLVAAALVAFVCAQPVAQPGYIAAPIASTYYGAPPLAYNTAFGYGAAPLLYGNGYSRFGYTYGGTY